MAEQQADPSKRVAQKRLAEEVTKLVHGASGDTATGVTKYLTSQVSIAEASDEDLEEIRKDLAAIKTTSSGSIIEALASSALASSNSDARRLLQGGAIYINGQSVNRENFQDSDFQDGRLLLRRGKAFKDSALVELK